MKRAELFHPQVFSDPQWAEGYYQRNAKNIRRVGTRYVQLLKNAGFKGGNILDSGCGFGAVAIEIAQQFDDVNIVGIDLAKPLLKLAVSLSEEAGVADRVHFSVGDVQKLEFETDSFDVVLNTFMLHIVDDPVLMLNEIERVTHQAGSIMITDLRRIWLALVVKKLKTAFVQEEALEIINTANMRLGQFVKGPFWWDYRVGL